MMPTFLITCKTTIMRLGITSIIRDIFPDAILSYADSREEYQRILSTQRIRLMISDGTADRRLSPGMIREIRALQPDIKIMMLLEGTKNDPEPVCRAGKIDMCIRKNAPIAHINEAIQQVLS
jgi:DNA-binding NarL/FixJ family response regulator